MTSSSKQQQQQSIEQQFAANRAEPSAATPHRVAAPRLRRPRPPARVLPARHAQWAVGVGVGSTGPPRPPRPPPSGHSRQALALALLPSSLARPRALLARPAGCDAKRQNASSVGVTANAGRLGIGGVALASGVCSYIIARACCALSLLRCPALPPASSGAAAAGFHRPGQPRERSGVRRAPCFEFGVRLARGARAMMGAVWSRRGRVVSGWNSGLCLP